MIAFIPIPFGVLLIISVTYYGSVLLLILFHSIVYFVEFNYMIKIIPLSIINDWLVFITRGNLIYWMTANNRDDPKAITSVYDLL